jgi:hypothetical protein
MYFLFFFAIPNCKNKISPRKTMERKIKYINTMSEVDLYAIQSKFNQAKAEYITLLGTIQTTCLGNQLTKECQKAATLNADMQTYLIQMSNLIKNAPTSLPKQKELLNVSNQLDGEMNTLSSLSQEEEDIQVISNMNYAHALAWTLGAITIVLVILQSRK